MTNILVGESDCRAEDPMAGAHYSLSYIAYRIPYMGYRLFNFTRRVLTTMATRNMKNEILLWTKHGLLSKQKFDNHVLKSSRDTNFLTLQQSTLENKI